MSIWDVPLDTLQDSRLLALRMHVARYVVRAGAKQRSVVVVLDEPELTAYGGTLLELLEAAGAREARVVVSGGEVPEADILLLARRQGDAALPLDPLATLLGASLASSLGPMDPPASSRQVWEIDVDRIAGARDARIVESVEALIRIVMPEALGGNGTPPDESVAVRIA